jgi:hypothetical protein
MRLRKGQPARASRTSTDSKMDSSQARILKRRVAVTDEAITVSLRSRFRGAMALAIVADVLQIAVLALRSSKAAGFQVGFGDASTPSRRRR